MPRVTRIAIRHFILWGLLFGWPLAHATPCEPLRCDCPATGTIHGLKTQRDPISLKSLTGERVRLPVAEFDRLLVSHDGAIPVLGNENGQVIFCTAAGQPVRGRRFYFETAMQGAGGEPPLTDLDHWCPRLSETPLHDKDDRSSNAARLALSADQVRQLQERCSAR
jgi:hypothetical protein